MDRYSILIFPCNKIERNFLISKKFRRKKMDCFLNNTKIKIQWIQKEFKRASILETELGINLDKQKQLISHCAFPLSRYLFFVFPRSFFFHQDGKRPKYLVSNSTERTFLRVYR